MVWWEGSSCPKLYVWRSQSVLEPPSLRTGRRYKRYRTPYPSACLRPKTKRLARAVLAPLAIAFLQVS